MSYSFDSLSLTKELVKIPSISTDVAQLHVIIDYLMSFLTEHMWDKVILEKKVYNDKPSLIAKNFESTWADICINWHVDVVPPSEEDQFIPVERDGKLYWRGTIDMKAAVSVSFVSFMKAILWWTDKKLMLMITTDEEVGWKDGAWSLVEEWYWADVIITPDARWLMRIATAEKWVYTFDVRVEWTSCHSAYPWKWDNALEKSFRLYQELKESLEETVELLQDDHWWTSVQMTKCTWWKAHNIVPGFALSTFNIRHTESYTETILKNMCSHICKKYDATITWEHYAWLLFSDEDHPAVALYSELAKEVIWDEVHFGKIHWATDAAYFSDLDTTVILHGLAWEFLHAPWEYVDIASLTQMESLFDRFLQEYQ